MLHGIVEALGIRSAAEHPLIFTGSDRLPSCFPVTELAAASIGAASLAAAELIGLAGGAPTVSIDLRLASLWFGFSIRPQGWSIPAPWDAIAGDYRSQDGWIKLHTNAPHHKEAALSVLGCRSVRDEVAGAVAHWGGDELEQAIVDAGGCAARLRTRSEWQAHPQYQAVAGEPLVIHTPVSGACRSSWHPDMTRPLKSLRVLDLTRVLAGPVATRFLAGLGAQVLRIDPPGWDEPGVAPEITLGKRCARLDLRETEDRSRFERLLSRADILVHGYRSDALERLGFGSEARQVIRPGLVDVSLDAYGHGGPWKARRGFDSLVQFSAGIAATGRTWKRSDAPVSLPVQALDHATGYLMAAAAIRGIIGRMRGEPLMQYRLSLARTAELLFRYYQPETAATHFGAETAADVTDRVEQTSWGPALRVRPPASIGGISWGWDVAAAPLGSAVAEWIE